MLYFVTGLPRSGSTLLQQLLGQNPNHYVSPTSALIEMFVNTTLTWRQWPAFIAEGLEKVAPRVRGALGGMLNGFYKDELAEGKIIFDKSRGWMNYIGALEDVLGREVKMIVCIRDIRGIIASFERLYQNRGFDYAMLGPNMHTVENRIRTWLAVDGMVGHPISTLRDALQGKLSDRLILLPLNYLASKPSEALANIHEALGLPDYDYEVDTVEQITHEDDYVWGQGENLHKIRGSIEPVEEYWEEYIPEHLAANIAREYSDIMQMIGPQHKAITLS